MQKHEDMNCKTKIGIETEKERERERVRERERENVQEHQIKIRSIQFFLIPLLSYEYHCTI